MRFFTNLLILFSFFVFYSETVARVVGPDTYGYIAIDSNEPGGPEFNWIDITGTGNYWAHYDDDSLCVPIGFDFVFYGTTYDTVCIGSNGYLTFGYQEYEFGNDPFPEVEGGSMIAPFFDDLIRHETDAGVYYQTLGTAPNRMFVVTWYIEDHYYSTPSEITFQVILYEGTNQIKFQYDDVTFGDPWFDYGGSATVGLNKGDGIVALQYSYNEPILEDGMAILITQLPHVSNGRMFGNLTIGNWPNFVTVDTNVTCNGSITPWFSMTYFDGSMYHSVVAYSLDYVLCYDDPSITPAYPSVDYDSTIATLNGTMDGYIPVKVELGLKDRGEPGIGTDYIDIRIKDMNDNVLYQTSGYINSGSVYAMPLY